MSASDARRDTLRRLKRRRAGAEDLGLTRAEFAILRRLDSPQKIETFVYDLKQNFELDGDCCRPVRGVLRECSAHCIEAAMLAAAAFWIQGEPPLLVDMRAVDDFDHVIAVYRRGRCWGAISKTNSPMLRNRDPVYRSLRELMMSYFHEYTNKRERRTLREYSAPFDLRHIDPAIWSSGEAHCWEVGERLDLHRHYRLIAPGQARRLTRPDPFLRKTSNLLQYPKPKALIERERRLKRRATW